MGSTATPTGRRPTPMVAVIALLAVAITLSEFTALSVTYAALIDGSIATPNAPLPTWIVNVILGGPRGGVFTPLGPMITPLGPGCGVATGAEPLDGVGPRRKNTAPTPAAATSSVTTPANTHARWTRLRRNSPSGAGGGGPRGRAPGAD